jgi:hypothetical protein
MEAKEPLTVEQIADMRGKLVKHFDDIAAGICPVCAHPMCDTQQIGRCVYARPCGCHIYQGRARR